MNEIMNMLQPYLTAGNFAFVVMAIITGFALYHLGVITKTHIIEMSHRLILHVEKTMKTEEGKARMDAVVLDIHQSLPSLAKIVFTQDRIRAIAQSCFDNMKSFVEDKKGVIHTVPEVKK